MTDLSPSTLAAIAERLPGVDMIERREGRYAVWFKGGKWYAWSAWDLIGAMLERAAESGGTAIVEISTSRDGRSTTTWAGARKPGFFNVHAHGTQALAAVSAAFIQLPKVTT